MYSHFVFVGHTGHVDLQLLSRHWVDRSEISAGHQHQLFLINRATPMKVKVMFKLSEESESDLNQV